MFGVPNTGLFSSTPHPPLRFHNLAAFSSVGSQRAEALDRPAENKGPSRREKQSKQTPPARSRDPVPPASNLRLQLSPSRAPQPRPGLSSGPAPCPAARAHSLAPFRSASPLIRFRLLRYALRLAPPPTERQRTQARLVVTRGPYSVSLSPSSRHSCFRFLTALWFFHL